MFGITEVKKKALVICLDDEIFHMVARSYVV